MASDTIRISLIAQQDGSSEAIDIPWIARNSSTQIEPSNIGAEERHNPKLTQAIVRSHLWLRSLNDDGMLSVTL
jgi:hypothetical protein